MKRAQTMVGSEGMSPTMKRGTTFSGSPTSVKKRAAATTLMQNIMQPVATSPPPRRKKIQISTQN